MNDFKNVGKSFMAQHKCKFCHKEATRYITYKEAFAFLCNEKDCGHKFDLESKFFTPEIEIKG
jgi:hypothetical protein